MHFVGIDVHRKRSQLAVLDGEGRELRSRRIVNDPEVFLALLAEIDGECRVALEASYGWEWLAEPLEDAGYEPHLAHPFAHEGDRLRARKDRRRRRAHARAPVAQRPAAAGLHRAARATRPARSVAPPGRADADALGAQEPRRRGSGGHRLLPRAADRRRDRRHHPLHRRPPPVRSGETDPDRPQLRRQGPARAHLPPRLTGAALGPDRGRPTRPPRRRHSATPTTGSPSAAAPTSPRSPSRARSSRSASPACATEKSVARHPGPRRARKEPRRSPRDPPTRSPRHPPGHSRQHERARVCQWPHPPHPDERRPPTRLSPRAPRDPMDD